MAQRPDGKAAKTERVTFTRPAAERIAKVVRAYEAGSRDEKPLVFRKPPPSQKLTIRTATFTGAWNRQQTAAVTFVYGNTATATVYNDLISLPNAGSRYCIVGKEGTAWRLINWQWEIAHAATQAELTTTMLRFHTLPVGSLATASTITFNVSVASCSTT